LPPAIPTRCPVRQIGLAVLLAVNLMLAPLASDAQEHKAGKVYRIGVLWSEGSPQLWNPVIEAFRRELWELGYVEGLESRSWNEKKSVPEPSVVLEFRSPEGRPERLPELAAELVRLKVDVILAQSNPAIAAAQKVTTAIPIVMVIAPDPIASGFAASLSWPSGNITGLSVQGPDLPGKALQFLKDAVPNISRVAVLSDPGFINTRQQVSNVQAAALTLGVQLQVVEVRSPGEIDNAFAAATRNRVGAALNLGSPMLGTIQDRTAELAARHRLPTMCGLLREYMRAGCLLVYGPSVTDQYVRAAYFVDRILKGAKPTNLPIEQPTKFYLVVNLKTAKALRLTIPQSVLGRADEIIE